MSTTSSSSSSSRISIPNHLRKTIQNLKEIAKNHSDDEIYAMLNECAMDPNETAQKLLLQDPFHEVKRKRDKRKENNKEPVDTRLRPTAQGRVGGGGRGNYSSRYMSHDAGGEKNVRKENGTHQPTDKGITSSSLPPSQDKESKSTTHVSRSVTSHPNGPAKIEILVPRQGATSSNVNSTFSVKERLAGTLNNKASEPSPTDNIQVSVSRQHGSGVYASASDPVLEPSLDACIVNSASTIKREITSRRIAGEATVNKVVSHDISGSELSLHVRKGSSEMNHSQVPEKVRGKSHRSDGCQFSDASQPARSLSRTNSVGSRPSSNYSNRSQQLNGPPKVGPTKEWKPKLTTAKPSALVEKHRSTNVEPTPQETVTSILPSSCSISLDEPTSKLQNKLEELQLSDSKHVIIPNHLQVPESERTGLSFGSFDSNFTLTSRFVNDTESEKHSSELLERQDIVDNVEAPTSSGQISSPSCQEADISDHTQSAAKMPENLTSNVDHLQLHTEMPENLTSGELDSSSSSPAAPECDQSKTEVAPVQDSFQYSVVHTSPAYSNFELAPQVLGNQFTAVESADPQARDVSRMPSFLVQQPLDPATSYYTSVYRPPADGDGRFSPFFPASATKYNGNVTVLPAQTGQTPQEGGNSLVLPSTGSAPLVTSGLMQTSLTVSQQPLPVFRQPHGVHISQFPPNYLPYSQYVPPFYIPSPSMHPFLSNAAFPQQPPTGNIYPAPGSVGAAPVKYSISQYKPATNAGNQSHIGVPSVYGTYSPAAVTSGSSTGSGDLSSSQYKDNNVYIAGQQIEGSVWIPTPGRDISAMQAASFYNLSTQGQQMAFPGMYHHPPQAVATGTIHPMLQQSQATAGGFEMVGPPGVYQQSQRTQMNWGNN